MRQNFDHEQRSPNHDCAIGQVKHRPLILLHIKQQKINDSATPVMFTACDCLHSSTDTTTIATTENPISIAVFQCAGESANRLNAAPVFSVWVRRKNPGITWICSYIAIRVAASRFVSDRAAQPKQQ